MTDRTNAINRMAKIMAQPATESPDIDALITWGMGFYQSNRNVYPTATQKVRECAEALTALRDENQRLAMDHCCCVFNEQYELVESCKYHSAVSDQVAELQAENERLRAQHDCNYEHKFEIACYKCGWFRADPATTGIDMGDEEHKE